MVNRKRGRKFSRDAEVHFFHTMKKVNPDVVRFYRDEDSAADRVVVHMNRGRFMKAMIFQRDAAEPWMTFWLDGQGRICSIWGRV